MYDEGYTIKGVQKLFKEQGVQALSGGAALDSGPPAESANGGAPPAGSSRWRGHDARLSPSFPTTISRRCAKRWPQSWTPDESLRRRARRARDADALDRACIAWRGGALYKGGVGV